MPFWNKKDTILDEMQRQTKVRCNSDGLLSSASIESAKVRVRELSWYGVVLDRVDPSLITEHEQPIFTLSFTLPREFGQLQITVDQYSVTGYSDVIGGDKCYLDVSLPEGEALESIRRYLYYRNRSFIRNSVRRNRSGPSQYFLLGLWVLIAVLGMTMMGHQFYQKGRDWWITWWY
jgi:hypothetical protein